MAAVYHKVLSHNIIYAFLHMYYSINLQCPKEFPNATTVYRPLEAYKGSWYELYTFPNVRDLTCKCPITHNTINGDGYNGKVYS